MWGVKKFFCYLFGRKFTLLTDHQLLISIFGQKKGIPATAASRMQRYALFLQGYDYDIEYKSSKSHANCDGLSRLPYSHGGELPDGDSAEIYNLSRLCPGHTFTDWTPDLPQMQSVIIRGNPCWSVAFRIASVIIRSST